MTEKKQANKSTRRDFLKKSGYVTGGVVGGSVLGGLLGKQFWEPETKLLQLVNRSQQHDHALEYFTNRADFQLL